MRCVVLLMCLTSVAAADDWYAKAVRSVEAAIDPGTARPGQTVKFRLTVDLHEGYHTYPTLQPDKKAAAMVNKLTFPEPGALIFVGTVKDPEKPDIKPEPLLGIKELRTYSGRVVYERTAVVSPKASGGEFTIAVKEFLLNVCDADTCYPAKKLVLEAKVTVAGAAMPVEKEWQTEVEKALAGK